MARRLTAHVVGVNEQLAVLVRVAPLVRAGFELAMWSSHTIEGATIIRPGPNRCYSPTS